MTITATKAAKPKAQSVSLTHLAKPNVHQHAHKLQAYGPIVKLPIALSEKVCSKSMGLLNQMLAYTMTFRDRHKKHHWQVAGPTFHQLHMRYDLWRHVANVFVVERKQHGLRVAAKRVCGAMRAMMHFRQHRDLFTLPLYHRYIAQKGGLDGLIHLSRRYFLSTRLTPQQRIDCALSHYRHESEGYSTRYHQEVYCEQGITLWSKCVDDVDYSIRLEASATDTLRCEGVLCVSLYVGRIVVATISFSWVDSRVFGANLGVIPFVTRNQSEGKSSPELLLFRKTFPQNSPPYFCFAALCGIAEAHAVNVISAVRHDCQVSFQPKFATGFRNSYCGLWQSFGAVELDRQAVLLKIPFTSTPISALKPHHRSRALHRRRHWSEISQSACDSVSRYRDDSASLKNDVASIS